MAGEPGSDFRSHSDLLMTGWLLGVLVVALALAAASATAETSLTSVGRIRIRARQEEGDRRAAMIERLHADPGGYLGTILVANTLALVLASSSATLLAASQFGTGGAFWSALALALLVLLVCEIGPKAYALQHNEQVARVLVGPVTVATRILGPLVRTLTWITSLLTRLLPGEGGRRTPFLTEEELKALVSASSEEGVVEEEEREMIHGVLEMTDKPVREVMVPRVQMVALANDASLEEAIATVLEHGHSRIPVYEDTIDNITGVVYAKDLLRARGVGGSTPEKVSVLARPATFVPEAKRLGDLLQEMQLAKIHLVVVVDEYGGTAGLVTIEDVLEEIVGPIRDEYDLAEQEEIQLLSPAVAMLTASASLDDVNDILHLHLQGEDFDSVGGLVYSLLGRIPSVGDVVDAGDGVIITVESIERQAIQTVRLTRDHPFEVEESSAPDAQAATASAPKP
ncbi:MAG: hemolysin family protein [Candidatus Dormibacteria bacterium]